MSLLENSETKSGNDFKSDSKNEKINKSKGVISSISIIFGKDVILNMIYA